MAGRPINADRQSAFELGLRTYTGTKHPACGTTTRYVAGGGCVHCARIIATEQRHARKFLKEHEAEYREAMPEMELDTEPQDGLDDAEARRQADIDELM